MMALLLFLILNFILFIPLYYFNKETTKLFPFKDYIVDGKFKTKKFFFTHNRDFFKFNLEFSILILIFILAKNSIPIQFSIVFTSIFYGFTLIIFYYHYSIYSIYDTYPATYSDLNLIKQGIQIAYMGYKVLFFLGLALFIIFSYLVFLLISQLLNLIYTSSNILLPLCCISVVVILVKYSRKSKISLIGFDNENDFNWIQICAIQSTIRFIIANRHFNRYEHKFLSELPRLVKNSTIEIPPSISLSRKPNIYFIGIESYGAILYENEVYKDNYKTLLAEIEKGLIENKFHVASRLSKSPVTGGGSWMAFSSFLNGANIKTDAQFRNLVSKQKEYPVQSIFNILEEYGYRNYLVSAIGGFENFKVNWANLLEFHGTKNVIKYKDFEYKGVRFNMGPSAPDQYMLNKSIQIMKAKYPNQPISFFVETINSHYNFHSPTQVFPKWEECNHASLDSFNPTTDLKANLIDNYFSAIKYQLKTIEDLILNEPSDTIFVLFGDHQPPLITNQNNSYKTPLHIISKDKEFIQEFHEVGFYNSLMVTNYPEDSDFKHNDFKKLFMEVFLKTYQKQNK